MSATRAYNTAGRLREAFCRALTKQTGRLGHRWRLVAKRLQHLEDMQIEYGVGQRCFTKAL